MEKIAAKIVDIKLQLKANTDAETYKKVSELLYEIYKIASEGNEPIHDAPDGGLSKHDVNGSALTKIEAIILMPLAEARMKLINEYSFENHELGHLIEKLKVIADSSNENNGLHKHAVNFSFVTCMDCGQPMTHVRPGKYQCDNPNCFRNQ